MAQHVATFCGSCNCGCPELYIDHEAPETQRVVLTDDFGQRVQMSADQWQDLVASAKSGELDAVLTAPAT
ncbi:hypothetical protein SAMN05421630_102237 [Prauserella marina]|uniref:Uncharacterized protein n=1 Tax=Prauserella marina TaxID=530584 RepID=A0A1G6LVC5_9PSEU|nr:hypothetical protein [Prauserella marina]PWV85725.1 hypothetical protein DES30_1011755 [Prauserella marina]SDC47258.1 hypothetical protein SAMN05421630_102237 [Prauserella marina]